jgi:hypothetical protein
MNPVTRDELLDYQTYAESRPQTRPVVIDAKEKRRVHLGQYLTFLFENHQTVRYQIQEMMLAERIVKEADIRHEMETYNELLGGPGELGATLLIEIETPAERDVKLREWLALPRKLYVRLEDGTKAYARFDARQVDDRLSSVHYLKFDVKGRVPAAVGCDLPALQGEQALTPAQREALTTDLG